MIKPQRIFHTAKSLHSLSKQRFSDLAKLNYINFTNDAAVTDLIVLHGVMGNKFNFRSIAKHKDLKSLCNSYLFDLRNHGKSEHKPTMTLEQMANDLEAAVQQIGLDKFYLMGHSLGGKVAMEYSKLFAERLKGLIIIDIGPFNYNDTSKFKCGMELRNMLHALAKIPLDGISREQLELEIYKAANEDKNLAGVLWANIEEPAKNEFRWRVNIDVIDRSTADFLGDLTEPSKKYNKPVKIIAGGHSEFVPRDELAEFEKVFDNFDTRRDVVYLEGADHWVHFGRAQEFVNEVSSFIKQNEKL